MTFDPYRTLGLRPDASLDEVKRAYRALAKRYHPDRAGEEETARFLAVQAAYEQLVLGRGRVTRGRATPPPPWQADPERARASREAYRARRARTGGTADGGPGAAAGGRATGPRPGGEPWWRTHPPQGAARTSGVGGLGAAGAAGAGRTGSDDGAAPGSSDRGAEGSGEPRPEGAPGPGRTAGAGSTEGRRSSGRRRSLHRRRTTLTSTTYDEVKDPIEPDWQGASWYGPSSGTFWRINPREYADPRKHGPEYQARARRATAEGHGAPPATEADPAAADPGPGSAPTSATSETRADSSEAPIGSAAGHARRAGGAPARAQGPAPSTARAADPVAPIRPGPARRDAGAGSGALGAAVVAGGVVAVPATVLLLGAGPTAESSTVALAFLAPPLAALVAGIVAVLRSRRRP